jgi:hypothetical protein
MSASVHQHIAMHGAVKHFCNTIFVEETAPLLVTTKMQLVWAPLKERRYEVLNPCAPRFFTEQEMDESADILGALGGRLDLLFLGVLC